MVLWGWKGEKFGSLRALVRMCFVMYVVEGFSHAGVLENELVLGSGIGWH